MYIYVGLSAQTLAKPFRENWCKKWLERLMPLDLLSQMRAAILGIKMCGIDSP
jgi:hypothetical protein